MISGVLNPHPMELPDELSEQETVALGPNEREIKEIQDGLSGIDPHVVVLVGPTDDGIIHHNSTARRAPAIFPGILVQTSSDEPIAGLIGYGVASFPFNTHSVVLRQEVGEEEEIGVVLDRGIEEWPFGALIKERHISLTNIPDDVFAVLHMEDAARFTATIKIVLLNFSRVISNRNHFWSFFNVPLQLIGLPTEEGSIGISENIVYNLRLSIAIILNKI